MLPTGSTTNYAESNSLREKSHYWKNGESVKTIFVVLIATLLAAQLSLAQGVTVTKVDWISHMKTALPEAFCQPNMPFRQGVSAKTCAKIARASTIACLEKIEPEVPETLAQPDDGTLWGNKLGECAGTIHEVLMRY